MSFNLDSLNERQRQAVLTCEGPLLVLAGAGSGKTRVLTYRIAHMLRDLDVAPWQILAITFTNKAAREMRDRLDALLGDRNLRGMWVCTFHAMCIRMLRIDGERLGYSSNFTIYDDDDSKRLMKSIMADLNIDERRFAVNGLRSRISAAKSDLLGPDEFAETASTPMDEAAAKAYDVLQRRLVRANAMDFDDILVNAQRLLAENPDLLDQYQRRFRYISVDEYQDTNHAQYQICKLLAAAHHNIMVVGDDDQSIYSWRGADIRNILDFEKDYPEAVTIKLEENYRSSGHILAAANAVVANNSQRKPKRLFTSSGDGERVSVCLKRDEIAEANYVAGEIRALKNAGESYGQTAVFYRTNAQSRVIEDGLVKAGIPYRIIGGTRFFDRAEIRDVMAYLKLAVNPSDDVSARRVINKPARGIGETTQQRIEAIAAQHRISFFEAAADLVVNEPGVNTRTKKGIVEFLQVIGEAQSFKGNLADVVETIIDRSGIEKALLSSNTDDGRDRADNVREFLSVVKEYVENHSETDILTSNDDAFSDGRDDVAPHEAVAGELSLAGFMEWLALRTDLDVESDGGSAVTLMTVHSAKGLEFDNVFVCGMEERVFPLVRSMDFDPAQLEEERRLAYVAITRARKRLYLCYADQRRLYGEPMHNRRSRFIDEIPEQHMVNVGVGSESFEGFGFDRRGSRHGIGGAGHDVEVYGGRVFGNKTRSSGTGSRTVDLAAPKPVTHQYTPQGAGVEFGVGDRVNHKKFGLGTVIECKGDQITVRLDSGAVKNLLKGYAPIVKVE